ncbi:3-methyladenine DNA glycosylase [Coraliomargarita sinensis]|uniref:3-methyladenine DNA glycosylase n=1 Tax=Coraliomargarita sinensis TaxID=2174842 RepID=A0A317ZHY2_9BACT|nr:3-methyladenine DNA glycosylase [Coraliomargarita sinensis]PXA05090.1 3-methyladenine DNA glycosylase [Coraliomargarita sinensis]
MSTIRVNHELRQEVWRASAQRHYERASEWTEPYRGRRASGKLHPVYDFLFIYYRFKPSQLEAWHPQFGINLIGASGEPAYQHRYYIHDANGTRLDPNRMEDSARHRLEMALRLCEAVDQRPPQFGCFGMHEWAMVYRGDFEGEIRHAEQLPLRLSQEETDAFVRSRPIACSHFDAFRFFSEPAKAFNRIQPTKETRIRNEQCGCLHTNMDLYKLCGQCMPWLGSELMWQCFELAIEARKLDMRASPYDCRSLGFEPVKVETPAGRSEYEQQQRTLSERSQPIRREIIGGLKRILTAD